MAEQLDNEALGWQKIALQVCLGKKDYNKVIELAEARQRRIAPTTRSAQRRINTCSAGLQRVLATPRKDERSRP